MIKLRITQLILTRHQFDVIKFVIKLLLMKERF